MTEILRRQRHGPAVGVDREVEHPIECREEGAQRPIHQAGKEPPRSRSRGRANQPNAPQRRGARVTGRCVLAMRAGQLHSQEVSEVRSEHEVREQGGDHDNPQSRHGFLLRMAVRAGPVFRSVPLEEDRAQGRTERQRVERRNDRRGGDRQGELPEELAADAGHECGRHEDRAEHQGNGDHRPGNLGHRRGGPPRAAEWPMAK